jgi:hypothetical protein
LLMTLLVVQQLLGMIAVSLPRPSFGRTFLLPRCIPDGEPCRHDDQCLIVILYDVSSRAGAFSLVGLR